MSFSSFAKWRPPCTEGGRFFVFVWKEGESLNTAEQHRRRCQTHKHKRPALFLLWRHTRGLSIWTHRRRGYHLVRVSLPNGTPNGYHLVANTQPNKANRRGQRPKRARLLTPPARKIRPAGVVCSRPPRRPSEREHGGKPQHAEIVFAGETPVFIGENPVFAEISPVFAVEILVFTGKTEQAPTGGAMTYARRVEATHTKTEDTPRHEKRRQYRQRPKENEPPACVDIRPPPCPYPQQNRQTESLNTRKPPPACGKQPARGCSFGVWRPFALCGATL